MSTTRRTRSSESPDADDLKKQNEELHVQLDEMSKKMEEMNKTMQKMLIDNVQTSFNNPVTPSRKKTASGEHDQAIKIAELMQETAKLAASSTQSFGPFLGDFWKNKN